MMRSLMKNLLPVFFLCCATGAAHAQRASRPVIERFSPQAGAPGQEVRIKGKNFGNNPAAVEVRLGGVPTQVIAVKNNEIRVRITQKNRTGVFQLAVSGVRSDPTSSLFEISSGLKATKMDPRKVSPGGVVKIYGSGFSSNPRDHKLVIGQVSTTAKRMEGNAAVFTVPKNAAPGPNTVRLEVKNRGVINIPVPLTVAGKASITGLSPTKGAPGGIVTIYGSGFGNSPTGVRVIMGGMYAQVNSVSPRTIVATVPAMSAPSAVTVQTKTNGTAVSAQTFMVSTPIIISNFSPTAGQPGQLVRLYGQGFDSSPQRNRVTINGKKAQVTEAAPNTLVVKIPPKASSGPFVVTIKGRGAGESQTPFQVAEPISISKISPESGGIGTYVRITGKGFITKGMRAFIGRKPVGLRVYSATQALIGVPGGTVDGPVIMVSPTGAKAASKKYFKVIPDVSVNKFYPLSGRPGTKVTMYGDQFKVGRTKVYLGKTQLKIEPGMKSTMMVVSIPEKADSGPFRVAVKGRREVRSVGAFKVLPPITTYTPPKKKTEVGTGVTVKPDDKPVIEKLMEEKPSKAVAEKKDSGKAPTIDELLGFESDGETAQFSSMEPQEGPVGETIMINGSGFGDAPKKVSAWVGGKKAEVVGCVPDMLMIEVPQGASTGKVKIKIGGKPPLTSKTDFVVK